MVGLAGSVGTSVGITRGRPWTLGLLLGSASGRVSAAALACVGWVGWVMLVLGGVVWCEDRERWVELGGSLLLLEVVAGGLVGGDGVEVG